jgi:biotin transport system substrate-specific component
MISYSPLKSAPPIFRFLARVAFACCLLIIGSKIIIPLKVVPITLQCLAVYIIGFFFSPRDAFCSVLLFLGLGLSGWPVFVSFCPGFVRLVGPTGGYLIGMLLAAPIIAKFVQNRGSGALNLMCGALIGLTIIFAFGAVRLAMFVGWNESFTMGVLPFLIPEAFKIATAVFIKRKYVSFQR